MPLNIWFWIIMALWLVLGLWREYIPGQPYPMWRGVGTIIEFILFALIGWKLFGSPIQ
jgi:hypothetical protein